MRSRDTLFQTHILADKCLNPAAYISSQTLNRGDFAGTQSFNGFSARSFLLCGVVAVITCLLLLCVTSKERVCRYTCPFNVGQQELGEEGDDREVDVCCPHQAR